MKTTRKVNPRKTTKPKDHIDRVLIVNDLHCGAFEGLTPPSYWNNMTPEPTQWLWKCWECIIEEAGEVDLLILNGDLVDGKQSRADGVSVISTSMAVQTDIAIECVGPLASRAKKIVRLEGTPYHETFDGPLGKLDATFGVAKPNNITRTVRDIILDDTCAINVKHQPEGSAALYMGTVLDREVLWATIQEHNKGLPKADILIRAHLHHASAIESMGKQIHLCPCFCLQMPYARNRRYYRWQPDIGVTFISRDSFGGWVVRKRMFDLPKLEAVTYEEI